MHSRLTGIAGLAVGATVGAAAFGGIGWITGRDIKDDTVTSADIRDGTLRPRDFRSGTLVPGPRGPAGPAGPQGPPGTQPPAETVKVSLGQVVPVTDNGQVVVLPWDKEVYDDFGMHDPAEPTALVAASDGLYRVTANIQFNTNESGSRYVVVYVGEDPSQRVAESLVRGVPAPPTTVVNLSGEVRLSAGQAVRVAVDVFGAGSDVPVNGAENEDLTFVTMTRISP